VASAPAPGAALAAAPVEAPAKLDEVLAQAGLQLASTDPEKLRAAQEAAVAPPVRLGRARKPVVAPVDEPLVQVDTRQ
jgi:ribonuclease E